jgi:hypothetical protein
MYWDEKRELKRRRGKGKYEAAPLMFNLYMSQLKLSRKVSMHPNDLTIGLLNSLLRKKHEFDLLRSEAQGKKNQRFLISNPGGY